MNDFVGRSGGSGSRLRTFLLSIDLLYLSISVLILTDLSHFMSKEKITLCNLLLLHLRSSPFFWVFRKTFSQVDFLSILNLSSSIPSLVSPTKVHVKQTVFRVSGYFRTWSVSLVSMVGDEIWFLGCRSRLDFRHLVTLCHSRYQPYSLNPSVFSPISTPSVYPPRSS